MGNRRRILTPVQEVAMVEVRARVEALAELKAKHSQAEQAASDRLSLAVAQAARLGVPKTRVGTEGLMTTSPNVLWGHLRRATELREATP